MYQTHILKNGLNVIHQQVDGKAAWCGLIIGVGSRDERPEEEGIAHFIEHVIFKGTEKRKAWHILNRMENVGGELNAYTTKEDTCIYASFLARDYERALELFADIVFHSVFPEKEIEKEKEVVIDEINSYKDSPGELIFDDFENLIFCGHPLGRNILGEAGCLRGFHSEDIQRFARRLYRPDRMVFFVYGRIEPAHACREITKALKRVASSLPEGHPFQTLLQTDASPARPDRNDAARTAVPEYRPQTVTLHKDTHQAHVMIGARAYSARDPRHLSLYLLNNILGGPGMNSRLNLSLREKHGLVYTVESVMTTYTDTGLWSVYFGCDPHDVARCRRLVLKELRRLAEAPLAPHALEAAKRQIKGQIGISYDNFENVALAMGKTFLHYDRARDLNRLYQKIDGLTAEDLHAVAQELFRPENLTFLIYR